MKFKFFSKDELKYIAFSGLFAFVYFLFLLPFLINIFDGKLPFLQFLIFNLGLYFFFFLFLKSFITRTSITFLSSLGMLFLYLALDTWSPEYHINFLTGELISGGILGVASTDYIWGLIANGIGLSGILVTIFTYLFIPLLLLSLVSLLFKNFVEDIL